MTDVASRSDLSALIPQSLIGGLDEQAIAHRAAVVAQPADQEKLIRPASREPHDLISSRNPGDIAMRFLTGGAAAIVLGVLVVMFAILITQSQASISTFGLSFLTSSKWNPPVSFGALPAIEGTLYSSVVALLLAAPVGVLIAIFLAEMSPKVLRFPIGFLIELLAAVPSIIYGLWALFVLVPLVSQYINPFLSGHFGWIPIFTGPSPAGLEILSAVLILSVMILPTIAAISRDVILAVPQSQREAMYGLGATRWETTWKVIVPYARSGIIGGIILALGRALGETMAVQMVIGGDQTTGASILNLATTIPANIVNTFTEATPGIFTSAILELALILLVVTVVINGVARLLVWSVTRKYAI